MPVSPRLELDLPAYYAVHLHPGAIDLSASSPPSAQLRLPAVDAQDCSFVAPTGAAALRAAIAARYTTLTANDILLCSGASEALAAVALATLDAGSTLVADPSTYPSVLNAARHCGATIAAPGTATTAAMAVLTNPGVPFGDVTDTTAFIAESLRMGALPVVDEVYRDLALEGVRVIAAADIDPRAVSIGDLSKPLGLGGLRIGWLATRNIEVLQKVDRELQLLSGGPSSLSVAAAVVALATFDESLRGTLNAARSNREAIYETLARHGWSIRKPQAGLTAIATPPHPILAVTLAWLEQAGYFLLPASVFGLPGGYRVSLLADPVILNHALGLLKDDGVRPQTNQVVVLTKAPGAGRAKTRLAATLGTTATERLALAFIADTLALATSARWSTIVALDPPEAAEQLQALAPRATFVPQASGDLGRRIESALTNALAGGPALLIGSDTPDLPASFLEEAFAALQTHDAVLGPARDGGFYLIGVRKSFAGMFAGVEWSTPTVFERTSRNMAAAGRSCAILQQWQDVDDAGSLASLADRLATTNAAPATRELLASLATEAPHD